MVGNRKVRDVEAQSGCSRGGSRDPNFNSAHATSINNVGPPDTRIFSPHAVPRLCDTIGHYWYLFKRLTAFSAGRFYRFEHIVSYSSGKVIAKSVDSAKVGTKRSLPRTQGFKGSGRH